MCTLLPESEVVAAVGYPIPFKSSEGPTDTACEYDFNDNDHAVATIVVGAESYAAAQEVTDGIMATVDNYRLDGWPTEQLTGVGDDAWWLCQTADFGECTLYVRKGTYQVSVQTTPSQNPPLDNNLRKGVAIALANLVMGRLP